MYKNDCVIEIFFQKQGGPPMQDQSSLKTSDSFQFRLESLSRGEMPFFPHMSVVAMGRPFALLSLSPSARLTLSFDSATQCLDLI